MGGDTVCMSLFVVLLFLTITIDLSVKADEELITHTVPAISKLQRSGAEVQICGRQGLLFEGKCLYVRNQWTNFSATLLGVNGTSTELVSFASASQIAQVVKANNARNKVFPYVRPLDLKQRVWLGLLYESVNNSIIYLAKRDGTCKLQTVEEEELRAMAAAASKTGSCGSLSVDKSDQPLLEFGDCSAKMPTLLSYPATADSAATPCNSQALLQKAMQLSEMTSQPHVPLQSTSQPTPSVTNTTSFLQENKTATPIVTETPGQMKPSSSRKTTVTVIVVVIVVLVVTAAAPVGVVFICRRRRPADNNEEFLPMVGMPVHGLAFPNSQGGREEAASRGQEPIDSVAVAEQYEGESQTAAQPSTAALNSAEDPNDQSLVGTGLADGSSFEETHHPVPANPDAAESDRESGSESESSDEHQQPSSLYQDLEGGYESLFSDFLQSEAKTEGQRVEERPEMETVPEEVETAEEATEVDPLREETNDDDLGFVKL